MGLRKLWAASALAGICMTAVLHAADRGGRLVYTERQPLLGFEPIIRTNVATTRFCSMLFEQLLDRKRVGVGVQCRLCESFDASPKLVTFHLKKGVLWHDGIPMTAQDVAFSFRAIMNPETGSALAKELEVIEDVTVLDAQTVSFSFKQVVAIPEVYFLALPVLPAHKFSAFTPSLEETPDLAGIRETKVENLPLFQEVPTAADPPKGAAQVVQLPKKAQLSILETKPGWVRVKVTGRGPVGKEGWLENYIPAINAQNSADFLTNPVGTGPYKFTSATINGDANLKVFDQYHSDKAYIEAIRRARSTDSQTMVTRLTSEIIDLIPDTPLESMARITSSGVARTVAYPSLRFVGFLYNFKNPVLAQKPFRQALTYGTNRSQWLATYYQSQGALIGGPASPDSWLFDSQIKPYPFDMAKAKELLGSVQKSAPLSFNLIVSNDRPSQDLDMLQALVDSGKGLGVSIKITVMEPGVYAEALKNGQFDMALCEYQLGYGYNYRPLFESGSPQNYGHYQSPELDKLFEQWRVETDFEKIRALARQSQVVVGEDCPYTFLWSLKNIASVNNKVRRISPETIDPYRFFAWVHLWWIPEISQ